MKVRAHGVLLVFAALALLAVPATAAAYETPPQGPTATLLTKGTHGYTLSASIGPRLSSLSIGKGFGSLGGTAEYSTFRNSSAGDRFAADFGHLGRISVRFKPSGKVRRKRQPYCSGGFELTRFGSFEGTIRFSGEHGYTSVDKKRVAGTVTTAPRLDCHLPKGFGKERRHHPRHKRHRELVTTLSVSSARDGISLVASRTGDKSFGTVVFAVSQEAAHGVRITRFADAAGPEVRFDFDSGLNTATLAPGGAFSGSATYQRIDDYSSRWEGPLTVSFPGRPDVPLTGRGFSWSLDSARRSNGSIVLVSGGGWG